MAANEFLHVDPGSVLTQNEYNASPGSAGGHKLDSQATGDMIYASSATILRRLAKGSANQILHMGGSNIPEWSSAITATTIDATTDFTIGSTVITDDVITFTPTASDTVTMTAATNGAFSLVTVDAAAAAANIQITADGTVDIDSAGVLTLDSGAAINIEPASGSAILLDGTISIDAGVVTGATSITSTTFVGALTGNASGTAATVTGAAQSNITSLGTLTTLTVDNVIVNGATVGHTSDTDLMTLADGVLTVAGELDATTLDISGNADIDGTLEADAYTVDGTALNEYIADTVGAMFTSNTETRISATYQDGDNTIDLVVDDMTGGSVTDTTSILNTSLVVGRDSHNQIKFSTDDEIIFMVAEGELVKFKASGEVEAASLDISGNADIDGNLVVNGNVTLGNHIDDIITINGSVAGANAMIFEGATTNTEETTLTIVDPDADRTIYLPNQSGYIPVLAAETSSAQISTTVAELNLIDGGTARGTTAIADGDGVLINDAGTMRMTTVQTLAAYLDDEITAMPNLITVGTIGTGVWQGTPIASGYIAADAITAAKIGDNVINSEHYATASIDNEHLADNAVDSAELAAGSVDTAHIADDQITLAKMASGTDGNIISYDASGNPVAIATGNDGQVLTSTGAGSPPAFEDAGGGGGIEHASQWRITAATALGTVSSNWEEVDGPTSFGVLGSSITESSGIFTFPATGYWLITFQACIGTTNTDTQHVTSNAYLESTHDNSTYATASYMSAKSYYNGPHTHTVSYIMDVEDTANDKVRMYTDSNNSNWTVRGNSSIHHTGVTFVRLGDT